MRIGILGGYGNTGIRVAHLLASRTPAKLVLLGRDETRLKKASEALSGDTSPEIVQVDGANEQDLLKAFENLDLVIVASSSIDHVKKVAGAAIRTGTDYFDVNLSTTAKISVLKSLEPKINEKDLCFITDGGCHPGLPAAMVRFAAGRISTLQTAVVGGKFDLDWRALSFSEDTSVEFMDELKSMDMSAYVNGQWRKGWKYARTFDFGPRFGRWNCVPMGIEEMRELPGKISSLRETGFFVAGFGRMVDYVIMPFCFLALSVAPDRKNVIARFFLKGLKRFASSGRGAVIVLEADGRGPDTGGLTIRISHADAYHLTAVPVVACVSQYLDGQRKPGLWTQGNFVEPVRFFEDLAAMGLDIEIVER